jgi:hypothetical protein
MTRSSVLLTLVLTLRPEDKERAKAIKTEIYSRLVARGGLDPYFPLTREGDKWLSYDYKGELYVEAFDTERGRKRAMKEYEAAGATNLHHLLIYLALTIVMPHLRRLSMAYLKR